MSKESKSTKEVEIIFDQSVVDYSDSPTYLYGILVEKKGKKFIGKCDPDIKKAMLDAGKCEK